MHLTTSLRVALLACGLLLAAACSAHNGADAAAAPTASAADAAAAATPAAATTINFTEGNQFVTMKPPAGQAAPTGPIELIEAFSYGCPHCAEFAPYMDKLRAQMPKHVTVRYIPVTFNQAWVPYSQAFYAARQLGVLDKTHDAFFKAMREHYPLNSLQDMATFYGRQGVDPKKFLAAATDQETMREMQADQQRVIGWGVNSTPTLLVGRRASNAADAPFVPLIRSNDVTSYEELEQAGLWMVKRVEQR